MQCRSAGALPDKLYEDFVAYNALYVLLLQHGYAGKQLVPVFWQKMGSGWRYNYDILSAKNRPDCSGKDGNGFVYHFNEKVVCSGSKKPL